MRWLAFSLGLAGCLAGGTTSEAQRKRALDAQLVAAGWVTPDVPSWTAEELRETLRSSAPPVVVDVREPNERAVSTLPGAISVEAYEAAHDALAGRMVVAYCTVGVRSGKWVADARRRGVDAHNLDGGVLAWSWVGGAFELNGERTPHVHVWSKPWSLLAEGYIAVW